MMSATAIDTTTGCLPVDKPRCFVTSNDTAARLLRVLGENRWEDVVVLAEDGRCVGTVGLGAMYAECSRREGNLQLRQLQVAELCIEPAKWCPPHVTLHEVVGKLLLDTRPVLIGMSDQFVGVLDGYAVLTRFAQLWPQLANEATRHAMCRVEDVLEATLPLPQAVELLVRNRVRTAVLTHNDTVLAAVTAQDVARWQMASTLLRLADAIDKAPSNLLQALPCTATVLPHDPLAQTAHLLGTQRVQAVPVVNRAGHLVGVVTAERVLGLTVC